MFVCVIFAIPCVRRTVVLRTVTVWNAFVIVSPRLVWRRRRRRLGQRRRVLI